jgi:uncharacterized membrane protein YecN with MAPEG domain
VRQLQFAAVRAFLERGRLQRVMAAAHVPLRRRGFSLGDSHCGTFKCVIDNNKNCDDLRLITAGFLLGFPAGGGRIVANRGPYSESGPCCKRSMAVQGISRGGQAMTAVPVTLVTTATCALLNFWLGFRIGQFRGRFKVSVGDGGQEPLLRRMRAQANFIESAPFFLLLLLGLEMSGANRVALGIVAALFVLVRVAHAIGMERAENRHWRQLGAMGTGLTTLALVIWALVCAFEFCLGR